MNKIINEPEQMIAEMLEGYIATCPDLLESLPQSKGILMREKKDKVSIVTGGGSGNEPWIIGYVGKGLADGAALGNVYIAPPARAILNVTKAVNHKKGVIYICTNHAGDVLNFELVGELAEMDGIRTRCVFVADDITSAPREQQSERRGVAGVAMVMKVAGAACDAGLELDEAVRVIQKANRNTFTFSVTTSPGYLPSGKAMCEMPDGFIEYGMGFNGEPGVLRTELKTANEIADTMLKYLLDDSGITRGDEIAVMVNGFGFTSLLELSIVNRRIAESLTEKGIILHDIFIDTLFQPQGTGGFSISMLKLDDELKPYYDAPAYSPFFKKYR
ncbi:dihydroxyacetone kinase subunit DhaK [Caproiciproducens faecalis]|uniref:Dihydroxyacetone kinase subunit DhaK n=1 Tax=Caproiciproducens faecalis TaxID=2820301 RepID=A0ABS7DR11_9FIRM|nr:dihydroxyacetone kinase subunit DhaK [Caproiciproducens faecalis]MBW7573016.1 dihydroxyacetone kinase subunit DhaK [Caproiciproducens faecalis]